MNSVGLVWFRQLASRDGAIEHSGDNLTGEGDGDDETIHVDLQRLPGTIQHLVFTVNSFRGQTFDQVENAYCRILDDAKTRSWRASTSRRRAATPVLSWPASAVAAAAGNSRRSASPPTAAPRTISSIWRFRRCEHDDTGAWRQCPVATGQLRVDINYAPIQARRSISPHSRSPLRRKSGAMATCASTAKPASGRRGSVDRRRPAVQRSPWISPGSTLPSRKSRSPRPSMKQGDLRSRFDAGAGRDGRDRGADPDCRDEGDCADPRGVLPPSGRVEIPLCRTRLCRRYEPLVGTSASTLPRLPVALRRSLPRRLRRPYQRPRSHRHHAHRRPRSDSAKSRSTNHAPASAWRRPLPASVKSR